MFDSAVAVANHEEKDCRVSLEVYLFESASRHFCAIHDVLFLSLFGKDHLLSLFGKDHLPTLVVDVDVERVVVLPSCCTKVVGSFSGLLGQWGQCSDKFLRFGIFPFIVFTGYGGNPCPTALARSGRAVFFFFWR